MATSKKLMDWQHYDKKNKYYNFVIARHNETNEIHAILGFSPISHFDKTIKHVDLALAIWKVRDNINTTGLGITLISYLVSQKQPRSIYGIGINTRVLPIYKYMGYDIGIMNHYYIANKQKNKFHLIGNFEGRYNSEEIIKNNGKKLIRYEKSEYLNISEKISNFITQLQIPAKSYDYLYNRYYQHPIYNYHIYGLKNQNYIIGFIVLRLCSYKSNYAIRIVDYFGHSDGLVGIYEEFQRLLETYDAEYIDFYNIGIEEKILSFSGFIKRDSATSIIVPNYFEPFQKKNVDLHFAFKCNKNSKFIINKGDSDQDRPSILEKH